MGRTRNLGMLPLVALAILAIGALAIAGCGGGSDEPTTTERNLLAQYCPLEEIIDEAGQPGYGDPVEGALDTSTLIGMTVQEAEPIAAENGCVIKVSYEDGRGIGVQLGFHPNRILVFTEDNVITQVDQVG